MGSSRSAEPLAVRYVRAGGPSRSGVRLQEWRSDLTGRAFEVDERDAYATAEELEPGAAGHLSFVGGTAVVTRRADDPVPAPPSRAAGEGLGRGGRPAARAAAPARNVWLWLLIAAAVGVLLARLLALARV